MVEKVYTPKDEQELVINYMPSEMGKDCEIYTCIPTLMDYLEKMANEFPEQYKIIRDDKYGLTVRTQFKLVKPRKPKILSEERRAELSERLRNLR